MTAMTGDRTYPSDDRDLPRCDNELVVFPGENGDWYVSIRKIGDRLGPHVRVTTSGAPSDLPNVGVAVKRLYEALHHPKKPKKVAP